MSVETEPSSLEAEELTALVGRLRTYNAWRRGGDGDMPDPVRMGQDIDAVIEILEAAIEKTETQ